MNTFIKVIGWLVLGVGILVAGFLLYFNLTFPKVGPADDITVQSTPERVERGKYLANHVTVCMDCHSSRNWKYFSGPPKPGTLGAGGDVYGPELGLPGVLRVPNITPYKLGKWTDGEIIRAMIEGVNNERKSLFPLMPYQELSHLAKEDVYSLVAYLRTLKPIKKEVAESELDFPLNLLVKTIPTETDFGEMPDPADTVAYGEYMVTIGGCHGCHTPRDDKGQPLPGVYLAGGEKFKMPGGTVRSLNLTPHETGLGEWTTEAFVERFKMYNTVESRRIETSEDEFNTPMPWTMYAGIKSSDLKAMFAYLQTIDPVENQVTKYTPDE